MGSKPNFNLAKIKLKAPADIHPGATALAHPGGLGFRAAFLLENFESPGEAEDSFTRVRARFSMRAASSCGNRP